MVAMRFASHGDTIQNMAVLCNAVVVQTVMKNESARLESAG
jgi:hypothetical protein